MRQTAILPTRLIGWHEPIGHLSDLSLINQSFAAKNLLRLADIYLASVTMSLMAPRSKNEF
jgi:hypothetical protein